MSARFDDVSPRRKTWLVAALISAALLVLPALAWVIIPRPAPYSLPPAASVEAAAAAPEDSAPRPAPKKPTRRAAAATAEPDPDGPFTGVVLDPDGRGATDASVGCEGANDGITVSPDGSFTLPRACKAVAEHADFLPSEPVQLVAGRKITLQLRQLGAIAGEVVDGAGAPVKSYLIAIETFHPSSLAGDAVAKQSVKSVDDPTGAYVFGKLPPGRYVLTASAHGHPPAHSETIEVEMGRTTYRARITLEKGGTLSGHVLDADTRRPIPGAHVAFDGLTLTGANYSKPTRSDEAGAYTMEGAPPGPFSVRVTAEGYVTRTVSGSGAGGGAAVKLDVELRPQVDGGPSEEFAGIGAILGATPGGVMITTLVPGGPAERAQIQVGDIIARIDGADASGYPVTECMQRLRGGDGSIVRLGVKRNGQLLDFNITRRTFVR